MSIPAFSDNLSCSLNLNRIPGRGTDRASAPDKATRRLCEALVVRSPETALWAQAEWLTSVRMTHTVERNPQ